MRHQRVAHPFGHIGQPRLALHRLRQAPSGGSANCGAVDKMFHKADGKFRVPLQHPFFTERATAAARINQFAPWHVQRGQPVQKGGPGQPAVGTQVKRKFPFQRLWLEPEFLLLLLQVFQQRGQWQVAGDLSDLRPQKQAGFEKGEIISIGAMAEGLGKSRNTAAKSVDQLVAKGMLARTKLKSPSQIVSNEPIFKDSTLVADEQISLTLKMDSVSTFSEVRRLQYPNPDDPFAVFLVEELAASSDGLIHQAATRNWVGGEVLYYLRMRSATR